jgi:pilus assembly protein Flp/PilA
MRVPAVWKKLSRRLREVLRQQSGQDLVEYALLIALVAFAATAGMGKLATGITTAFSNISKQLSTSIT